MDSYVFAHLPQGMRIPCMIVKVVFMQVELPIKW